MLPKPRLRAFLDSNVILSELYSSKGAPGIILERFIAGRLRVVISQQVLEETVRTVKKKLPEALPALKRLLVSTPPEVREDPVLAEVARWSKVIHAEDAAILAAAVAAEPDYLVTGDRHFFENPGIAETSGLHIVTPAEFLKLLENDTEQ